MSFELDTLVAFFGKFHPLIVHLPIGMIFFWIVLVYLNFKNEDKYIIISNTLLLLTFLSSVFAGISGFLLSDDGGYEEGLLEKHKWTAIGFTAITGIIWFINSYLNQLRLSFKFQVVLVIVTITTLSFAGHFGGSLTHGEDFLSYKTTGTKLASNPVKVHFNTARLYEDAVQPIFNAKCISCHGKSKKKGDLRLDSHEQLMKGGESGQVLLPGDIKGSELIKLIHLDPNEKRAMPPKGKTPLTEEEIAIIEFWVETGAKTNFKISETDLTESVTKGLAIYVSDMGSGNDVAEQLPEAHPIDEKILENLRNKGLVITRFNEKSNLLDVRVINNKKLWTDEKTALLTQIKDNIGLLDLSETQITNSAISTISSFSNLIHLQIQKNSISNIAPLANLKFLRVLNIYQTKVGDDMAVVAGKMNLKKLYTWGSLLTPKGIQKILSTNPDIEIPDQEQTANFIKKQEKKS